jgi:glycine cleavage system protein P-like pyridoxal-binding family
VAALMVTNPNTLGVFEENIVQAAEILHAKGAMLYMDGANMNALVGIAAPAISGWTCCISTCTRPFPHRTAEADRGLGRWL